MMMTLLLLGTLCALAEPPAAGTITVTSTLRRDEGQLLCALYSSAEGFMKDPALATTRAVGQPVEGSATCTFSGIAPGRYAIALLHDEDGDLEMDTRLFGIPAEGFGASNDAKPRPMGPPTFDAAAFDFDGQVLPLTLTLRYY